MKIKNDLISIKIGKKIYAALLNIFKNTNQDALVLIDKKPLLTQNIIASVSPIMRPHATMAGIIGTKISPKTFIICFNLF